MVARRDIPAPQTRKDPPPAKRAADTETRAHAAQETVIKTHVRAGEISKTKETQAPQDPQKKTAAAKSPAQRDNTIIIRKKASRIFVREAVFIYGFGLCLYCLYLLELACAP